MITRVTTASMMSTGAARMMASKVELANAQDRASTLQRISKPSDDPRGTSQLLGIQQSQARTEQYSRNVDNGTAWLQTLDSALSTSNTLMISARDAVIQAGNGAMTQTSRDALATQIDGIKTELLAQANTSYLGRSVFAGTSDAGAAFSGTDYTFTGVAGASVQRAVGDGVSVAVDADGSAVFGSGEDSVFALLDRISTGLRAGEDVSATISELDTHMKAMTSAQSDVGVRTNTIQRASTALDTQSATLQTQHAAVGELDLTQAVLDLQTQELNYKAALAVTARVLPATLMDYLR